MKLHEVIKADGVSEHINLECIRSIKNHDENHVSVTFCDGGVEVITLNTLMAAFKHAEVGVMSMQRDEEA